MDGVAESRRQQRLVPAAWGHRRPGAGRHIRRPGRRKPSARLEIGMGCGFSGVNLVIVRADRATTRPTRCTCRPFLGGSGNKMILSRQCPSPQAPLGRGPTLPSSPQAWGGLGRGPPLPAGGPEREKTCGHQLGDPGNFPLAWPSRRWSLSRERGEGKGEGPPPGYAGSRTDDRGASGGSA